MGLPRRFLSHPPVTVRRKQRNRERRDMASDNFINVIGNATRDPELRFTANGQASCQFGLAVNRRWQNRQTQEWEEQVSFFNIQCWGDLGDNVAESVSKGTRVMVAGRLEQRSYEKDGEKKSVTEIVADDIGISLRWATAQATRTERKTGGNAPQQQAAPAAPSGGIKPPSFDEEPF